VPDVAKGVWRMPQGKSGPGPHPVGETKQIMTKYEYRVFDVFQQSSKRIEEFLNDQAELGYELVLATSKHVFVEREIELEP
jgi:hypothetical protein